MSAKYKLAIFDFDGTLADTFPWVLSIIDALADRHNIRRLDRSEIETLRGCDAGQVIKRYNVPFWKVPILAAQMRTLMARDIQQIRLFAGLDRVLRELDELGVQLAVVSTNSYENICHVLGPEIARRVRYYECGVSLFGKQPKLKAILHKSGVAPAEAICIGDEIRDIQAAQKVNIPFGAVAWGYTRIDALAALAPRAIFTHAEQILEEIGGGAR